MALQFYTVEKFIEHVKSDNLTINFVTSVANLPLIFLIS